VARDSRVTLRDIANVAGVSMTTVSNVVNGRVELMSRVTRERVETAIRDLNYRPNAGARNLRLSQRGAIGLIIVDESPRFLADPMTSNIAAGISNLLSVNGYGLLVTGIRRAALGEIHLLRRDQTDGLCIMPSGSSSERRKLYRELESAGQPVVVFQDSTPASLPDSLSVRQDDRKGGELLARRLIDRGARRLALLVPAQTWPAMVERKDGLMSVVEQHPGTSLDTVICGSEDIAETQVAIGRYVERNGLPDAFLGGNDQMGIAALTWAQDRNLLVPTHVRVTGFNGFAFADYVRPRLTSVSSPAYEMGKQGAERLLARLAEGRFTQPELLFDVAIAAGDSD
jgi:LacI family transcriptional regulator